MQLRANTSQSTTISLRKSRDTRLLGSSLLSLYSLSDLRNSRPATQRRAFIWTPLLNYASQLMYLCSIVLPKLFSLFPLPVAALMRGL